MNIDVLELIRFVVDTYGLAGFALLFWVWHGHQLQKKIDVLQTSCDKMFGIMLSLADRRFRNEKGGGLD